MFPSKNHMEHASQEAQKRGFPGLKRYISNLRIWAAGCISWSWPSDASHTNHGSYLTPSGPIVLFFTFGYTSKKQIGLSCIFNFLAALANLSLIMAPNSTSLLKSKSVKFFVSFLLSWITLSQWKHHLAIRPKCSSLTQLSTKMYGRYWNPGYYFQRGTAWMYISQL